MEKPNQVFSKYIGERKVVIADVSATARTGLAKTMIDLGAKSSHVVLASSYESAVQEIQRIKPHIVLCDYDLGKRCGLDLLQTQRKQFPDSQKTLFVLVTGNSSQSAVAQAAEEDIDAFVLKPYTIEVLRNTIMRAALLKLKPSPYIKTIEEGKELLVAGKIEDAIAKFSQAKKLDPKPSLACFYYGQALEMQKALEGAQGSYNEGLDHNKIHYKCLVGLFDIMMARKMSAEAYEIVKKIVRYFPANPQRLNSVLRLAIVTKSYEDIERYYQIFTAMDDRNDELIRYVCAALVVCGKFYLQRDLASRAVELFQKAAATGTGRTKILKEIVLALAAANQPSHAQTFLQKFPAESQTSPEYLVCELAVADLSVKSTLVIDKGRRLLSQGIQDPAVYRILIRRSQEANLKESADSLSREAAKLWPELGPEFLSPSK